MMNWPGRDLLLDNEFMDFNRYGTNEDFETPDNFIEKMMLTDTMAYLPEDILTKVDRATMATSLEARAPLLDFRIIEYAWQLPLNQKYAYGKGKLPLRALLSRYMPHDYFERPKQGFGIPVHEWLRGPLREWGENLLDKQTLKEDGYFNVSTVRTLWRNHLSGKQNYGYELWNILVFQSWLKTQNILH